MDYTALFKLAEKKGYEFETIWYDDTTDSDFLQTCEIEKWLRDQYDVFIAINVNKNMDHGLDCTVTIMKHVALKPLVDKSFKGLDILEKYQPFKYNIFNSWEQAQYAAITEILKIIKV